MVHGTSTVYLSESKLVDLALSEIYEDRRDGSRFASHTKHSTKAVCGISFDRCDHKTMSCGNEEGKVNVILRNDCGTCRGCQTEQIASLTKFAFKENRAQLCGDIAMQQGWNVVFHAQTRFNSTQ